MKFVSSKYKRPLGIAGNRSIPAVFGGFTAFFTKNGIKTHRRGRFLACGALALLLSTCGQDPIFDMISREVKPRQPRIKGVPTKMAIFDRGSGDWGMYVAGSSLHRYAKGVWDAGEIPQPPGRVFDLAATSDALYALVNVDSPQLYRFNQSAGWTKVNTAAAGAYSRFQTIYSETESTGKPLTTNNLYIGANNSTGDYAVFHSAGGALTLLQTGTGMLTGAAYDGTNHYFSANGGGVYSSTSPSSGFAQVSGITNSRALIRVKDTPTVEIIALCSNGDLYTVSGSTATAKGNTGINPFGAAAVWTRNTTTLLLAASQASSSTNNYVYGYRELNITGGLPETVTMSEPGVKAPSTADDNKRYKDTIEPKPVNAIFQAPAEVDSEQTLFASVQGRGVAKDNTDGGLWSYRPRSGGWQWNAEE
ncbi:MAG: hypothetical protein LBP20_01215 [Treponema sp.]|jgi:hypothetical protein|nr:hypothetical protein [Treponema sp.]